MRRIRRYAIGIGVLLLITVGAPWYFLRSPWLAEIVRGAIAESYGGPVSLDSVAIGFTQTTLDGLSLDLREGVPLATIDHIAADFGLAAVLFGQDGPPRVTVEGVELVLRMDEAGNFQLPAIKTRKESKTKTFPVVKLTSARIKFLRPGFPEFAIDKIEAQLEPTGKHVASLTGKAAHAEWGDWTITGTVALDGSPTALVLATEQPVRVTQAMLDAVPFVPPSVWEEVQVQGESTAKITLRYDGEKGEFHYLIELDARDTEVTIPSLSVTATETAGRVVIDDGIVKLVNVTGRAFDGDIATVGVLDFCSPATRLKFDKIKVDRVKVLKLPSSFRFPKKVEGRISGEGWLDVTFGQGRPVIRGDGKGQLVPVRRDDRSLMPIPLQLRAEGEGPVWSFSDRPPVRPRLPRR